MRKQEVAKNFFLFKKRVLQKSRTFFFKRKKKIGIMKKNKRRRKEELKKEDYENIIKIGLDNGADFVEIFDEYSKSKSFILNDSKLDTINSSNTKVIGIRVIKNNEVYYSSTNIVTLDNLKKIIVNLTKKLNQERSTNNFKLNNLEVKLKKVKKTC